MAIEQAIIPWNTNPSENESGINGVNDGLTIGMIDDEFRLTWAEIAKMVTTINGSLAFINTFQTGLPKDAVLRGVVTNRVTSEDLSTNDWVSLLQDDRVEIASTVVPPLGWVNEDVANGDTADIYQEGFRTAQSTAAGLPVYLQLNTTQSTPVWEITGIPNDEQVWLVGISVSTTLAYVNTHFLAQGLVYATAGDVTTGTSAHKVINPKELKVVSDRIEASITAEKDRAEEKEDSLQAEVDTLNAGAVLDSQAFHPTDGSRINYVLPAGTKAIYVEVASGGGAGAGSLAGNTYNGNPGGLSEVVLPVAGTIRAQGGYGGLAGTIQNSEASTWQQGFDGANVAPAGFVQLRKLGPVGGLGRYDETDVSSIRLSFYRNGSNGTIIHGTYRAVRDELNEATISYIVGARGEGTPGVIDIEGSPGNPGWVRIVCYR